MGTMMQDLGGDRGNNQVGFSNCQNVEFQRKQNCCLLDLIKQTVIVKISELEDFVRRQLTLKK